MSAGVRVVVAAGASGGHVYPALATAEVLRRRGHDVQFVGGDRLEARVIPQAGFAFHPLAVPRPPSVRREILSPRGAKVLAAFVTATRRARLILEECEPDVVLGMGGFAAVPPTLAAGRMGIPLVLHEQNANLSLAQRLVMRKARVLALGLPLQRRGGADRLQRGRTVELVGNPVRDAIVSIGLLGGPDLLAARAGARKRLGMLEDRPTLLVSGGSLGSGPLNEALPRTELPADAQVLHLAGSGNEDEVRERWAARPNPVTVVGYLDAMEDAYLAADVVVCRSGAITVAELAVSGLPSVLVPLETLKRGDQEANARVLERVGAARVVMGSAPSFLADLGREVSSLLTDASARESMAGAARSVALPEAAGRLAGLVVNLAHPPAPPPSPL